jgi:signal transduction histidine kinase
MMNIDYRTYPEGDSQYASAVRPRCRPGVLPETDVPAGRATYHEAVGPLADLRRRLVPWQLRLLDIGLPLACALIALPFRDALASGWLLAGAVLLAGWLLFRHRLPSSRRTATRRTRTGAPRPAGRPLIASIGRLGGWRLWLLDAALALALTLLSIRLENGLDENWAAAGVLLVAGLLIQRRWPVPAAVLACAGALAHFYWGSFGPMPLDLAAPITVYTLASRASRRRVAVLAVGVLLAGVYAASLVHELTTPSTGDAVGTADAGVAIHCPPDLKPHPRFGCVDPYGVWPDEAETDSGVVPPCGPGQVLHLKFGCVDANRLRWPVGADVPGKPAMPAERAGVGAAPEGPMKPLIPEGEPRSDADRLVSGLLNAGGNGLLPMLIIGLALAFGDGVRSRRAHLRTLEQRASDLEREQQQRMALAAAAERARITRELHDVVAHGMSVMVVQAQGGAAALRRHPERTADALQNVISTGRASLAEMRRLLGVVSRDPTDDPELAPQPGLAALPALVDQVRAAGTPVRLSIEGQPVPLPASVDLSGYRIAQEALTNTIKHAGAAASAEVRIAFTADWIEIEVNDDGVGERVPPGVNGNGLRGIVERVAMLDGVVAVGPGTGGGFRVWALLPLRSRDAAAPSA